MMELNCLVRPSFETYELPSHARKVADPAPMPVQIVLISDRLARSSPVQLGQRLYRMTSHDHSLMKRALMASVKIRSRLQRG